MDAITDDVSSAGPAVNKNGIGYVYIGTQIYLTHMLAVSRVFFNYCTSNEVLSMVHSSTKRNALEGLMKHLCGCFESQSFSWSVIQSVLNHSNFLISDRGHGSFLGDVLPQQPVEVFIAASLPACKLAFPKFCRHSS